jgi:hypothetical protein
VDCIPPSNGGCKYFNYRTAASLFGSSVRMNSLTIKGRLDNNTLQKIMSIRTHVSPAAYFPYQKDLRILDDE